MFKRLLISIVSVVFIGSLMLGESTLVMAANTNKTAPKTNNTSTEPVVKKPEVYKYTSQLLPGSDEVNFKTYFVDTLLPRATRLLISLTAAASVIFIIYGGYRMLFYVGTPENLEAAKNIIIWAVAGLLISIFAFFIVSLLTRVSFLT